MRSRLAPRPPRLEPLEDRLALSAAVPAWNGINPSVPGDAYVLAGTPEQTDYTAQTKWNQPGGPGSPVTITYSYSNLLDGRIGLSASTVKAVIQEALSEWASAAPLRFVEVPDRGPPPSKNDYAPGKGPMIRFGHLTIDGPNNVLGYAYYPGNYGLAGEVTFDDSEHWTTNPAAGGYDLLEVATHEIGHALGLAHEPPPSAGGVQAIMNPYYAGVYHGLGTGFLFADDVNGIRALYGAGTGSVTPYGPPVNRRPPTHPAQAGFSLQGSTLFVTGGAGADTVVFDAASARPGLTLNGVAYAGSLAAVRSIVFDAAGGSNSVTVLGAPRGERFSLAPGGLTVADPRWNFTARNCQRVVAQGGPGDQAALSDTRGGGRLVASPGQTELSGASFSLTARGFGSVTAAGASGDSAWLFGGASPSLFVSTPSMARLSSPGFSLTADGFRAVYAYAGSRSDSATLGGSAGNDTLTTTPRYAQLQGPGGSFTTLAIGFASVTVHGNGGIDRATLHAGPGDLFQASPGSALLYSANGGYRDVLANFASVNVYGGSTNTATLADAPGANGFVVMAGSTSMRGAGYSVQVSGFGHVTLDGRRTDHVWLYDGPGGNTLTASGNAAIMAYAGSTVRMIGFSRIEALAIFGGRDTRRLGATSVGFHWWGHWE